MPVYAQNKSVYKDYNIKDKYEAGIILKGFEVKAIKSGKMNLKGSYVSLRNGDLLLVGANISPFQVANTPADYEPSRNRTLLLNAREKRKLTGYLSTTKDDKKKTKNISGYTVLPLVVKSKKNLIKIEIGLGQGLKKYDKRDKIKKEEIQKKMLKSLRF